MSLRALAYAYVFGGLTFIPLVIFTLLCITIYTSVPVPQSDTSKDGKPRLQQQLDADDDAEPTSEPPPDVNDLPRARKSWLTVRRTFEESTFDGSYVTLVKSYLDSRSKDPKRSRPKDMWYVVLKGRVMYLYEDENMTECEAVVELGGHDVVIYPEGLLDGELFTRRNAICLKPRSRGPGKGIQRVATETALGDGETDEKLDGGKSKESEEENREVAEEAVTAPWFIFVRSCVDMEDWYLALVHASDNPSGSPTLEPLRLVFLPSEMNHLVTTLDEQPDVVPVRWLNALLGRIFYSFYRTQMLESHILGRLMKKLSKVKRPAFLTDIAVTQFSIGNKAPTLSKPMLKELTKEGDASLEVGLSYKGEIRATVEATAVINLGARFKSYTVKLVLAVVLRELEGNLLIKVKRPPSSRIWYAFTKPPRMVINVEPIVSDRQITWSMILNTIESKLEEIIIDSVVMPNMDDISFFDSAQYEHRGGLWADAARSEKPLVVPDTEAITKPSVPEAETQPSEEAGLSTFPRAHSEEELAVETSPLDGIPIIRSATTSSGGSSKVARRRSWFSSVKADASDCGGEREGEDSEALRGRRSRSASSTPKPDDTVITPSDTLVTCPPDVSENEQDNHEYLSPEFSLRSLSINSQARSRSSRTYSISSSVGGDESFNYLSDSSATSKSPRQSMGTSVTSSFLSTLKSKAADKQALSNSAKEAMRKWGVNWGGLKKDNNGNVSQDDVADVGPSDPHSRLENTHGRQSYADIRVAVAERREREQSEKTDGVSSPIPIPQGNSRDKARSPSMSGDRVTLYSAGSTSSASSSPKAVQEGGISTPPKYPIPSLSRSVGDNVSNDPFKDRDFTEVAEDRPAHSLIHTQPSQARTMTIPGIHASHRGEVMSMGNVAPVSLSSESKPKGPTIHSMYRLWKSPIITGQQPSQEAQTSSATSSGPSDATERNHDVASLSRTPEVSPPPHPVPPPLPPRAVPSATARQIPEVPDNSSVVSSALPTSQPIVSEDETKQVSVELGATASRHEAADPAVAPTAIPPSVQDKRPPLPPRRTQAPA
ncbi:hypothetical protein PAXRUDRAFT_128591 [Paxillus rubicundulus Ve08.2h10]|uniref:SMP-LTD domain-containing protein n=1 Tax=Paxillus rubicundulus Ve08.2h10 TaxID=930991 RepID=A0A0D0E740_9AGAM|nr:hypothetical protein PAXRUDRAFT_128591 [Paxillus rubicundulus Ve08.2h10]